MLYCLKFKTLYIFQCLFRKLFDAEQYYSFCKILAFDKIIRDENLLFNLLNFIFCNLFCLSEKLGTKK